MLISACIADERRFNNAPKVYDEYKSALERRTFSERSEPSS